MTANTHKSKKGGKKKCYQPQCRYLTYQIPSLVTFISVMRDQAMFGYFTSLYTKPQNYNINIVILSSYIYRYSILFLKPFSFTREISTAYIRPQDERLICKKKEKKNDPNIA